MQKFALKLRADWPQAAFMWRPIRFLSHLGLTLLVLTVPGLAGVVDFDDLPSTYMYLGDGQNIGNYYSGLTFGPNVTGLDLTGNTAYPPHSPPIAVWDPVDLAVTISFDTPQAFVGFWYTSEDLLDLAAYDSSNTLLSSLVAPANTDGTTGTSDFTAISLDTPSISSVTLTGSPGNYVFDDVTYSETAVPEPNSILATLTALFLLARFKLLHGKRRYLSQLTCGR